MTVPEKDRQRPFKVYVSSGDRAEIIERARHAGMSASEYLRITGLNGQIRSVYDHDAVMQLSRVNGDLGRTGGLLKLWLTERAGEGASIAELRHLYDEIKTLQQQILKLMARI
jgi:hypothetical protein